MSHRVAETLATIFPLAGAWHYPHLEKRTFRATNAKAELSFDHKAGRWPKPRRGDIFIARHRSRYSFFLFFGDPAHSISSYPSRISRTRMRADAEKQKEKGIDMPSC